MKLLLTSAWNPVMPQSPEHLRERRLRLTNSIAFYASHGRFDQVVLLDATMDGESAASLMALAPGKLSIPEVHTAPHGDWAGPSYLEALLYLAAPTVFGSFDPDEPVFKISGGYIVRNIAALMQRYEVLGLDALGFLHQNPLRMQARYAMTSCMAMSGRHWRGFLDYLREHLESLRTRPLESAYRAYLQQLGSRRGPGLPYPRLTARFSTGGITSEALPYRAREAAWRLYSRGGLFVLSHRRATSP